MSGHPRFAPRPGDPEDVLWHLQAAQALGTKGQLGDAAGWLLRAAEAALSAGMPERAAELRAAAELLEPGQPGISEAEEPPVPERLSLEIDLSELAPASPEPSPEPPGLRDEELAAEPSRRRPPPPRPPILDPWSEDGEVSIRRSEPGLDEADPSFGDRQSAEIVTSAAPLEALALSSPSIAPPEPPPEPPPERPPPAPRRPSLRELLGRDLCLAAAPPEALDRLAAEAVGVDFDALGPGATSVAARPAALLLEEGELPIEAVLTSGAPSGAAPRHEVGRARPGDVALLEPVFEHSAPAAPPLALGASRGARGFAWSEAALRRALEDAHASRKLLSERAARLRALAGATSGPLGALDAALRAELFQRLELVRLGPEAPFVRKDEKASGICIVGAGSLLALGASLGPGAFVFPEARLHERPSPGDALAGPEGALLLVGDRATGQQLLVTVPALLDLFLEA